MQTLLVIHFNEKKKMIIIIISSWLQGESRGAFVDFLALLGIKSVIWYSVHVL